MPKPLRHTAPLTPDEREGIVLAVNSSFSKLKACTRGSSPSSRTSASRRCRGPYRRRSWGHHPPCESFSKGSAHCHLRRDAADWKVRICQDSGLTINQLKVIADES